MPIHWSEVFSLTISPWELIVRGSAVYWFLFAAFRIFVRRDMGSMAVSDFLLLMLLADAAQNAMAGGYRSFTDGAILIATLLGWNIGLNWLSYRSPAARRILVSPALLLVCDGRVLRHNLRKQFLTEADLEEKLREQGVESIAQVKRAYLESEGEISVLRR
jgi:uncharacterized membrane protein YcaP (DUF421 family)